MRERTIEQKIQSIRDQARQGLIEEKIAEERIAYICENEALRQINEANKKPTFLDYVNDFLDGFDGRPDRS